VVFVSARLEADKGARPVDLSYGMVCGSAIVARSSYFNNYIAGLLAGHHVFVCLTNRSAGAPCSFFSAVSSVGLSRAGSGSIFVIVARLIDALFFHLCVADHVAKFNCGIHLLHRFCQTRAVIRESWSISVRRTNNENRGPIRLSHHRHSGIKLACSAESWYLSW
jgi:hypothetical protein